MRKVISGGQIGVDLAGLRAAKDCKIETGGTMPKNFWTLEGPRPEYKKEYNIIEHTKIGYPPRTECNVKDADFTIWFGRKAESAGKKCTFRFIKKHKKPFLDIEVDKKEVRADPDAVARVIIKGNYNVINIAGNSDHDMEELVYKFLIKVFILTCKGLN